MPDRTNTGRKTQDANDELRSTSQTSVQTMMLAARSSRLEAWGSLRHQNDAS